MGTSTKMLQPKIRFKGFTSNWVIKKGVELFENRREKGKEGLPMYSVSIHKGLIPRSTLEKHMKDDAETEKNCVVKPGDIGYNTMRMWQGAMGLASLECMVSPAYIVLSPKINVISEFYIHLFKTSKYLHMLKSYSYGLTSDRLRLYYKDFSSIPFPNCSIGEQQKILDFITALDKRIDHLTKKIELLKLYKKGIMHQIFSRELCLRDEKGNKFPEWKLIKLGEAFSNRSEKGNKVNVDLLSVTMSEGVIKKSDAADKDNSSDDKSNYKQVKVGDIAYNTMRMWQGASGISDYDGIVSPAYTVVSPREGVHSEFFAYLFKYAPIVNLFRRNSQGLTSDTWNLKFPQFSTIKVQIPCIKEQKKITIFLNALDKKIELTSQQIELTKTYKKGLLQQMFV